MLQLWTIWSFYFISVDRWPLKNRDFRPFFVSLFGARCLCQNSQFRARVDRGWPSAGSKRLGAKFPNGKPTQRGVAGEPPVRCSRHPVDWGKIFPAPSWWCLLWVPPRGGPPGQGSKDNSNSKIFIFKNHIFKFFANVWKSEKSYATFVGRKSMKKLQNVFEKVRDRGKNWLWKNVTSREKIGRVHWTRFWKS